MAWKVPRIVAHIVKSGAEIKRQESADGVPAPSTQTQSSGFTMDGAQEIELRACGHH